MMIEIPTEGVLPVLEQIPDLFVIKDQGKLLLIWSLNLAIGSHMIKHQDLRLMIETIQR